MYTTCIYCQHNLGANDRIEHFQTGRKLAFDEAKGRLWVVCPSCGGWNLTPLEERWEAIEECEKLFRATPRRASTPEIALAKVPESLDLIRVGRPLRPEFAAWRYGERLVKRRRMAIWVGGGISVASGATVTGLMSAATGGVGAIIPFFLIVAALKGLVMSSPVPIIAGKKHWRRALHTAGIDITTFETIQSGSQIGLARASNADGWRIRLSLPKRDIDIEGTRAYHVLGTLLPRMSVMGASRGEVDRAVAMLDDAVDPVRHMSRTADRIFRAGYAMSDLASVPLDMRLSIEMASQEEAERRSLEGELAELEASWRRAEEVAAVADNLLLPASIGAFIDRHRPKRDP